MVATFAETLLIGGHANSLGKVNDVIDEVLNDRSRIEELYKCMFEDDAWVRMRAADAFEKICRVHPEWIIPYINRFPNELATSEQASIQWHLVQIYGQLELTSKQRGFAIRWMKQLLASTNVDWIVSNNAMEVLVNFVGNDIISASEIVPLLKVQQNHKSKAVRKRAEKMLDKLLK